MTGAVSPRVAVLRALLDLRVVRAPRQSGPYAQLWRGGDVDRNAVDRDTADYRLNARGRRECERLLGGGMAEEAVAIVQFTVDGEVRFATAGGTRLLVVDERVPHDRIFEVSAAIGAEELARLVPADAVIGRAGDGSADDETAQLLAGLAAPPRLTLITGGRDA